MIHVFIPGNPAPQGSKRFLGVRGGHGVLVENCKRVKPWRADIREALQRDNGEPIEHIPGAVIIHTRFVMPRPVSTPKRAAPMAMRKPDGDKLMRTVWDAITSSGVIDDDARCVGWPGTKRLAEIGETPGLHLTICAATPELLTMIDAVIQRDCTVRDFANFG